MGPREIPSLSVLCLRAIGNPKCNVDETFKISKDGKPSSASRLLRSFHHRPVLRCGETTKDYLEKAMRFLEGENRDSIPSIEWIPMKRTPSIGAGSGRRKQANDIDLNHPWIATYQPLEKSEDVAETDDDDVPTLPQEQTLVAEHGSCALDLLQSYVDALVELGRMDDNRLGLRFFSEVRTNIELHYLTSLTNNETEAAQDTETKAEASEALPESTSATTIDAPIPKKKKRKRSSVGASNAAAKKKKEAQAAAEAKKQAAILAALPKSKGSLSLHNCEILSETTSNLLTSKVLHHISTLDLTGLQTLTDSTLLVLLQSAGLQLKRLSVKNCRRLTDTAIQYLCENSPNLEALDIGGDYNIRPEFVVESLAVKTHRRGRGIFTTQALPKLVELHAGGIGPAGGWTDDLLPALFGLRGWRALSIGFSPRLTFAGWKKALLSIEQQHDSLTETLNDGANDENQSASLPTQDTQTKNMCHTLRSLGIAFCEQQLVDNAWLGLMGRHLPNLRALDVRGNHQLNTITSWYDGRATISSSSKRIRPKQSLVVLARYCGISQNSIEETKRIYPMAAGGEKALTVVTESDGIGWGILRQEIPSNGQSKPSQIEHHYRKRIQAATNGAEEKNKITPKPDVVSAPPEIEKSKESTVIPQE